MRASSWPRSRQLSHGMAPKGPFQCRQTHVSRSALHESHSLHVGSTMVMQRHDSGRACAKGKFSSRAGQTIPRTARCKMRTKNGYFILNNHKHRTHTTKHQTPNRHHDPTPRPSPKRTPTQRTPLRLHAIPRRRGRSTRTAARRRRRAQCAAGAGTRCTHPRAPRRGSRQAAPPRSSAPPGRHGARPRVPRAAGRGPRGAGASSTAPGRPANR